MERSWGPLGALLGPLGSPWGPKRPQEAPKRPQEAPKRLQGGRTKSPWAAKGCQEAPKNAQKCQTGPQESEMPLGAPKNAQDTPKRPPRGRMFDVCWRNSTTHLPISASFFLHLAKTPAITGQHQWGAAVARNVYNVGYPPHPFGGESRALT